MKLPVYQLWNTGLGDHFASLNLLGRIGEARRTAIKFHSAPEYRERHIQIIDVLDIRTALLMPEYDAPTARLDGFDVWAARYFPTRRVWWRGAFHGSSYDLGQASAWPRLRAAPSRQLNSLLTLHSVSIVFFSH